MADETPSLEIRLTEEDLPAVSAEEHAEEIAQAVQRKLISRDPETGRFMAIPEAPAWYGSREQREQQAEPIFRPMSTPPPAMAQSSMGFAEMAKTSDTVDHNLKQFSEAIKAGTKVQDRLNALVGDLDEYRQRVKAGIEPKDVAKQMQMQDEIARSKRSLRMMQNDIEAMHGFLGGTHAGGDREKYTDLLRNSPFSFLLREQQGPRAVAQFQDVPQRFDFKKRSDWEAAMRSSGHEDRLPIEARLPVDELMKLRRRERAATGRVRGFRGRGGKKGAMSMIGPRAGFAIRRAAQVLGGRKAMMMASAGIYSANAVSALRGGGDADDHESRRKRRIDMLSERALRKSVLSASRKAFRQAAPQGRWAARRAARMASVRAQARGLGAVAKTRGLGAAAGALASRIPPGLIAAGVALGTVAAAASAAATALGAVWSMADRLAKRYEQFSPELAYAKGQQQYLTTVGEMRRANMLGDELAEFVRIQTQASEAWEDIKAILEEGLLKLTIPILRSIAATLQDLAGITTAVTSMNIKDVWVEAMKLAIDAHVIPLGPRLGGWVKEQLNKLKDDKAPDFNKANMAMDWFFNMQVPVAGQQIPVPPPMGGGALGGGMGHVFAGPGNIPFGGVQFP